MNKLFQLRELDLQILSQLGKHPLRSNQSIGSALGVSRDTVARHLAFLRKSGNLLGVSAQVNFSSVGLEMVVAIIQCKPESWPVLEKVCEAHPYTRYRIRLLGQQSGFLSLFAVPEGSASKIMELMETLQDQRKITSYYLHTPDSGEIMSEANFKNYVVERGLWVFDWLGWEKGFEAEPPPLPHLARSLERDLGLSDMRILREVSRDILRPQGEIAEAAKVSASVLSRRLEYFDENKVIHGYRVLAGPFLTNLASVVVFRCSSSFRELKKVAAAVRKLPFQSTFLSEKSQFVLYATVPSSDIPVMSGILYRHCSDVQMYLGDYLSSYRWAFYPDAFNEGGWRSDQDYMVTDVLREVSASKVTA